jgi:hypothetical protein
VRVKKRGCCAAPRENPDAITRGCANTRRYSGCTGSRGYRDRLQGLWSSWVPFYVRGLGLDVPGEGVVITAIRPVDEWPGRLRSDGLTDRRFGVHGGSEKSQCERPSMGRWAPI